MGIGAAASLLVGMVLQIADPELELWDPILWIYHIFTGVLFSILSQLGFFAYMTLNYIAMDMIKRKLIWSYIQAFCVMLAFGYLIFLRYEFLATDGQGVLSYTLLPIILFAFSILVGVVKSQLTNYSAFLPTLFFMFVVTALEAIPSLRENNSLSTLTMVVPLFACNAWQILNLHKYVAKEEKK